MNKLKQIMYGVTDYPLMRKGNAYFVDRTVLIPELEKIPYALFLRPRRFGKSLLCAILQCYYDIDYAGRFEEFFGGLDIGKNPTEAHNTYLLLSFNFSMAIKEFDKVQDSFNKHCCTVIDEFARRHAKLLPPGTAKAVLSDKSCSGKLNVLFAMLKGWKRKLYVIIDEYDNFTNTILSESKDNYEQLCHGEGFFKQFFNEFKGLTTGADSPLARMFVTSYLRVRDTLDGERVVQAALAALLYVGHGPYLVRHEYEANGGYTDIAFEPQLSVYPQIGHAALIELKYVKAEEKLSKQKLAVLKKKAGEQLDSYAKDHDLKRAWCLSRSKNQQSKNRKKEISHDDMPCRSGLDRAGVAACEGR